MRSRVPSGWNAGAVTVIGGAGNATVDLRGPDDLVFAGSGATDLTDNAIRGIATVIGGSGVDTINGGGGRDLIIGGTDRDTLSGGDGEDILVRVHSECLTGDVFGSRR